jgi:hypothetical protein
MRGFRDLISTRGAAGASRLQHLRHGVSYRRPRGWAVTGATDVESRASRSRPHAGSLKLACWLALMALAGLTVWGIDWGRIWIQDAMLGNVCGLPSGGFGTLHGGELDSAGAAAAVGAVMWLLVGVVGWRFRRRLSELFVTFLALDIAGLAVLGALAPLIWGQVRCVSGS